MDLKIEIEREDNDRWIADIPDLPAVMAYGESRDDAIKAVEALALCVLADRLEHGETVPDPFQRRSALECWRGSASARA